MQLSCWLFYRTCWLFYRTYANNWLPEYHLNINSQHHLTYHQLSECKYSIDLSPVSYTKVTWNHWYHADTAVWSEWQSCLSPKWSCYHVLQPGVMPADVSHVLRSSSKTQLPRCHGRLVLRDSPTSLSSWRSTRASVPCQEWNGSEGPRGLRDSYLMISHLK